MDQLPSYDDNEEEILLMDTDGNNLQLDEPQPTTIFEEKPAALAVVEKKQRPSSSMFVREVRWNVFRTEVLHLVRCSRN